MKHNTFRVILSCSRWETLREMIGKYLYCPTTSPDLSFAEDGPNKWRVMKSDGPRGPFYVRSRNGRLQFGYFQD